MDRPFHVTIFDNFHPYDPDEAWDGGRFATAEEAIAAVKLKIDRELSDLWSEVCHQAGGRSTLERLIGQFDAFAELPVAFDDTNHSIFDSESYMRSVAEQVVLQEPRAYHACSTPPALAAAPSKIQALEPEGQRSESGETPARNRFEPTPLWILLLTIAICLGLAYGVLKMHGFR